MPSEFRQIVYRTDELTEALDGYREASDHEIPEGKVVCCNISTTPPVSVRIVLAAAEDGAWHEIALPPSTVAAALIAYCQRHGIIVPRHSCKSLQMMGESLALVIRMDSEAIAFSEIIEVADPYTDALRAG